MSGIGQAISCNRTLLGFFFLSLCLVPAFSDPIPAEVPPKADAAVTSSVATPLASSQLVASASEKDDGLTPVGSPKLEATDEKKTELPEEGGSPDKPAVASEVGDMMKDPYHNFTITTSDRDEGAVVDSETDTVDNPHVNPSNKTHEEKEEEEAKRKKSSITPADGSSEQTPEAAVSSSAPTTESSSEHSSAAVSSTTAPMDSSFYNVQDTEAVDTLETEGNGKAEMEQIKASEPVDEASSPPVSALVSQHDTHDHPTNGKTSSLSHTTEAAAILAGVLVVVALAGYLGLLFWRRVLEKRYGNREMLVNEDDDFKNFEL